MKKILIQIVLVAIIVFLGFILYKEFETPLTFEAERKAREEKVVERLKDIRTIQRSFRTKYGRFTSTFDSLINYVKNDSIEVLIAIGSEDDSLAVAQGKVKKEKFKVAVKDTLFNDRPGFVVDEIRYIPFSEQASGSKKEFKFGSSILVTESKVNVPVFEAFALYPYFLGDLDKQSLINYRDYRVNTLMKEDGLRVGSLDYANNEAGNWE